MAIVTWDSVNKGSGVTLSNGGLTATIPNRSNTVRATLSRNSGKWYWEIRCDSISNANIGIVNSLAGVETTDVSINAMYYYSYNGYKWNGTSVAYGAPYSTGDIISVLLDLDNGTIEFWKNGVSQGVAFTNVKSLGDVYPAVTLGCTVTANFGASPFMYKIPYGYYSYDGNQSGFINKILILSSDGEIKSVSEKQYSNDLIPPMTSNQSGSIIVSASTIYSTTWDVWKAFDGNLLGSNSWMAGSTGGNQWIKVDFGANNAKTISKINIAPRENNIDMSPSTFDIEGSNDNSTWTIIYSVSNYTNWVSRQFSTFIFNNQNSYRYYRINIKSLVDNSKYACIGEIELYEKISDNFIKSIPSQTEQDFINHGLDSLSIINLKTNFTKKIYIQNQNISLGSGKTFTQQIDLTRYKVNKISFQ